MQLINVSSKDDLLETLYAPGRNKKKADDVNVLQGAINEWAPSLASVAAKEDMKPQLPTYIINKFHRYAWAAMGNDMSDGMTPFNIMFMSKTAARAMATKVNHLTMVESGGAAMSYTDAQAFLKNNTKFPVDSSTCAYCLAAHIVLVNIMLMRPTSPYAIAYSHCVRELQSHLLLGLKLHYGDIRGASFLMALQILYWLTQQFLYFLSQRKFSQDLLLQISMHCCTSTCTPRPWMASSEPCPLLDGADQAKQLRNQGQDHHSTPMPQTRYSGDEHELEPDPQEELGGKKCHQGPG